MLQAKAKHPRTRDAYLGRKGLFLTTSKTSHPPLVEKFGTIQTYMKDTLSNVPCTSFFNGTFVRSMAQQDFS
jgi:hypothetical protein